MFKSTGTGTDVGRYMIAVATFMFAAMFLVLGAGGPSRAQIIPAPIPEVLDPTVLPQLVSARVTATPERARLILDLSAATEFALVSLDSPDRIAVDVKVGGLGFAAPPDVAGQGLVSTYGVEMAEMGRARTLLTLTQPAQVQQAQVLEAVGDQPARLIVDIILDTRENFAAKVAADRAAAGVAPPVTTPEVTASIDGSATTPASTETPVPDPGAGIRPLVIIDPGHGGIDNGASAPNGVHEKDIVLAYALELQALLVESGRFDVALTREDDTFLKLEERVTLARQNKADLFISLHADSFQQPEIRGASIYTRDERATDILDKVLAENENKRDIVAGFVVPEIQPVVVDILVDLMRRQMRRQSYLAAAAIVGQLEPNVALRRFPVRQADFFVLQAPDVPSVLVELGFLSNATDIANLQQGEWRNKVVESLAKGITAYFDTLTASN